MTAGAPDPGFRCSVASLGRAEPSAGTASTVRAFLLLEEPGPWGVDAVRDSRLPRPVKQRLAELGSRHRIRPLLIRRGGGARRGDGARGVRGARRVFAGYVHTDRPWLESTELDDVNDLLDLDLTGLAEGWSPGLNPHRDPLFLVCTHGRHDACCAERGRPLAMAAAHAAPQHTWEVSHIGGDRFAANLLVLPHGLYYGRLAATDAAGFVAEHLAGRLDLEHLRGRSAYPFSVQAAEIYLRRHLGVLRVEPLALVEHTRRGTETLAVFEVDAQRWEVRVHTDLAEPRQLTCRADSPSVGFTHALLGLDKVGLDQVGPDQVGPDQVGPDQVGTA